MEWLAPISLCPAQRKPRACWVKTRCPFEAPRAPSAGRPLPPVPARQQRENASPSLPLCSRAASAASRSPPRLRPETNRPADRRKGARRATRKTAFPSQSLPLGRARPRAPSSHSREDGGEGMANGVAAPAGRGSSPRRPALALLLSGVFLCLTGWSPPQAASAQPAVPCLAPLQWEGRTVVYDHSTGRNTRAAVAYDGSNQRLRILEERKGLVPCKKFFEYIYLYKDAMMFQIEQVTKLCSKVALSEPWDPYDIPDNSTYEDQYYIGGPGDQIMVQEWSDRKPARKLENWVGVYTVKDCYPVQETYTKNYSVTTSTRFFDLTLGISDPSVFIPPSTCQTAQPKRMRDKC